MVGMADYQKWPQKRIDVLLATFRELEWAEEPWQQSPEHAVLFDKDIPEPDGFYPTTMIACPVDTWGRDTAALCALAAERLVRAEGVPMLHLGPLTAREAAYATKDGE